MHDHSLPATLQDYNAFVVSWYGLPTPPGPQILHTLGSVRLYTRGRARFAP